MEVAEEVEGVDYSYAGVEAGELVEAAKFGAGNQVSAMLFVIFGVGDLHLF